MPYQRIASKADYHRFVKADVESYGVERLTPRLWLQVDQLRFLLRLRRIFGPNYTVGGIPAQKLSDTGAREHGVFASKQ